MKLRDSKDYGGFSLKDVKSFADFKHWFTNVYWYHFRIHTVVGVAVVILLAALVVTLAGRTDSDGAILMASNYGFSSIGTEQFKEELESVIGDVNGDGKQILDMYSMDIGDSSEYGMSQRMAMVAILAGEDICLILMDEEEILQFVSEDSFITLEAVGLPGERLVRVADSPKLSGLNLGEESNLMAAIIDRGADNEQHMELGLSILRYILS